MNGLNKDNDTDSGMDIARKTEQTTSFLHDEEIMPEPFPVSHTKTTLQNGDKSVINILEVDIGSGLVEVEPALSFGLIYGFEKLSDIFNGAGAYAAVNGGFFHPYGEPGGLVMKDGNLFTKTTGQYPVVTISGGYATMVEFNNQLKIISGKNSIEVDDINRKQKPGSIIVYTPVYGRTNRAEGENITVYVKRGTIQDIATKEGETLIPDDGMLVTLYPPYRINISQKFIIGDGAEFEYTPNLGNKADAYECGAWLLKDGENIAKDWDGWVGVLTNKDPRTAVGIKNNGKTIILITVDGRQPDYSIGVTAKQLAQYMENLGVTDAAMLDGGASTEMIVKGEMVNRPSHKGMERSMAGALIVKISEGN